MGLETVIVTSIVKSELLIAYDTVITSRNPLSLNRIVVVTLEIFILIINCI